ncbi:tetratricopeptide repeat protein [Pedobacter boryungensis]|uniref:Tetratricopeptide repeat protein n=1 Tax=Pedobacter boryungensis TaxID=869962 RepID=A0ABX2DB56_9SPHI|nr:tetratricopeptide repeat protein [Pedobacter boryungensis]NQX30251.1 tetratricopeptide repeat protein [Pedobacter boryungensis]
MKKILFFIFLLLSCRFLKAQSNVDQEKLLDFYQTQRYAEAAQYLQSIYPANTKDIKALNQIAYCYMMSGKLPEAEKFYVQINDLQPNTLSVLFSLANINTKRGNTIAAQLYLLNIEKLDSTNFKVYKLLAGLTDSIKLKVSYLKKANKLNPIEPDVAYDLAFELKNLKLFEPAYQVLKVAIEADTSNFILQRAQLPIANELKKYKEVIAVGERLLQNGGDANVIKDVGKAYFYLKNYQKCISLYTLLEEMSLQNETILYYMSLSYRELKNYEMASKYAKKTIDEGISVNTSTYYLLLGGIYEINNQLTSAVAAYKKGLTFKENPSIYYRLGLIYDLKLNQKQNALKNYNFYLKNKPDAEKEKEQMDYTKSRLADLKLAKK